MKIRTDFVTNSSSSSFIIGRHDEQINVDVVFNLIKEFYKEYLSKRDALKLDCEQFGLEYIEDSHFKFKNGSAWDDKNKQINKSLEKIYGIDTWDYFPVDCDWLEFETYKEYEIYWINRFKEADKLFKETGKRCNIHAPFSIADFSFPNEFFAIEDGIYCLENKKTTSADSSDIFGWYVGCGYELFDSQIAEVKCNRNCEWCSYESYKVNNKLTCDEIISKTKNKEITNDNAISMVLGKICIMSECGYIPDKIVDKLREISRFSCNHMG